MKSTIDFFEFHNVENICIYWSHPDLAIKIRMDFEIHLD